ncbi:hypothetical protein M413DRAFT_444263, partial [Hebeloma cylindrosporum]
MITVVEMRGRDSPSGYVFHTKPGKLREGIRGRRAGRSTFNARPSLAMEYTRFV